MKPPVFDCRNQHDGFTLCNMPINLGKLDTQAKHFAPQCGVVYFPH